MKKKIHFVGIKGVGMTPLAVISKEAGFNVTGCDIQEEFITDESLLKAKIIPDIGFDPKHVEGNDLIITTGAHGGFDNPEVVKAKELGIKVWSHGQAVGEFMDGNFINRNFQGISVSGTHGKTTTTAMIATILKSARLDPTFLVGTGNIPYLESNGHYGKGAYFVAEADEYATEPKYDKKPRFLWQKPEILVITNIELDHPDMYETIQDVENAFLEFTKNVKNLVVVCNDDESIRKIKPKGDKRVKTYGFSNDSDFVIDRVNVEGEQTFFWLKNNEISLGEFVLNVSGEHNALNATAAVIVALEAGVSIDLIKQGLKLFKGTKRRFEFIKKLESGALLYDDYAHHPTEIKNTLKTFKKSFPNKKLLCIFQPHTYSRTKKLFEHFVDSFNFCDEIILVDIYSSLREEKDESISSAMLKNSIQQAYGKDVKYFSEASDMVKYVVQKKYNEDWVIFTMGAGDIYKISEELI